MSSKPVIRRVALSFALLSSSSLLPARAQSLFYGGPDLVGRINTSTGVATPFPTFGFGGFTNELADDDGSRLFAYVAGTGVGTVGTSTGNFTLITNPGGVGALAWTNGQLFYGGADLVGRINIASNSFTEGPDLGYNGFVNAMAVGGDGTLYAYIAGAGVGTVNQATLGFTLATNPGSVASLAWTGGQLFYGGADLVGTINIAGGTFSPGPDLGFDAFVTALAVGNDGTLYANIGGAGVGTINTTTLTFTPLSTPGPVESLDFFIPAPLFADGFESGNFSAWSTKVP